MRKVKNNPTNKTFGRLFVKKRIGTRTKSPLWECDCLCGKKVFITSHSIFFRNVKSCGCLTIEKTAQRSITHGLSNSVEYSAWRQMKQRCFNIKSPIFRYYGGRGITVCDEWKHSFERFYSDMGNKPDKTSLERINNNGNYKPNNCKWATKSEQQSNRRRWVRSK